MRDEMDWTPPTDDELRSELRELDSETLEPRVERLRLIYQLFGPPPEWTLYRGGIPAYLAHWEMQRAFLGRQFVATVMLAQAFLEQSIAAGYDHGGDRSIAEAGFYKLVERARDDGHLPHELADQFQSLRGARNPYTHYRSGTGTGTYYRRILDGAVETSWDDVLWQDAVEALRAVAAYARWCSSQHASRSDDR